MSPVHYDDQYDYYDHLVIIPPHAVKLGLGHCPQLGLGRLEVGAEKGGRGAVEVLADNKLVTLE